VRSLGSSVGIVTGICDGNPKKLLVFSNKGKLTTKTRSLKQYSEVANTLQLIVFLTAMHLLLSVKICKSEFPCVLPLPKVKTVAWVDHSTEWWAKRSVGTCAACIADRNLQTWLLDKDLVVGDHCHLVYVSVTKWVTKSFVLLFVNTRAWILSGWYSCSFRGLKYPDFTAS
jgi:hypothetical protein